MLETDSVKDSSERHGTSKGCVKQLRMCHLDLTIERYCHFQ